MVQVTLNPNEVRERRANPRLITHPRPSGLPSCLISRHRSLGSQVGGNRNISSVSPCQAPRRTEPGTRYTSRWLVPARLNIDVLPEGWGSHKP